MPLQIGEQIIGNGVNLQPSYYNNGAVNIGWDLMKKYPDIKTVRMEIEPDKVSQAASWIEEANNNNYVVIATYHKCEVLGSDDANELIAAATWLKNNYQQLGGDFIINLMNEWGSHNITADNYAKAYNQAIDIVRKVYYNQPIIIDLPGWGQDADTAAKAAKLHTGLIKDDNIILSAHIYPCSWNGGTKHFFNTKDIDMMLASGRPCIIGEFGSVGDGNCNWSACVDYAVQQGLTVIGWCWNGDGSKDKHGQDISFNMVTPSWSNEETATKFSINEINFPVIYRKLREQSNVPIS